MTMMLGTKRLRLVMVTWGRRVDNAIVGEVEVWVCDKSYQFRLIMTSLG